MKHKENMEPEEKDEGEKASILQNSSIQLIETKSLLLPLFLKLILYKSFVISIEVIIHTVILSS